MKYKGSVCDYTEERNADILRAYKEIISVRDNIGLSEIIDRLMKSSSRRFWVSEERTYNVICGILRGESLEHMNPTKKAMYQEIFRRFKVYSKEHPSLTKKEVIWQVCRQPAPSFYISRKSMPVILHKVRKEEKRRCYELRKKRLSFMLGTL